MLSLASRATKRHECPRRSLATRPGPPKPGPKRRQNPSQEIKPDAPPSRPSSLKQTTELGRTPQERAKAAKAREAYLASKYKIHKLANMETKKANKSLSSVVPKGIEKLKPGLYKYGSQEVVVTHLTPEEDDEINRQMAEDDGVSTVPLTKPWEDQPVPEGMEIKFPLPKGAKATPIPLPDAIGKQLGEFPGEKEGREWEAKVKQLGITTAQMKEMTNFYITDSVGEIDPDFKRLTDASRAAVEAAQKTGQNALDNREVREQLVSALNPSMQTHTPNSTSKYAQKTRDDDTDWYPFQYGKKMASPIKGTIAIPKQFDPKMLKKLKQNAQSRASTASEPTAEAVATEKPPKAAGVSRPATPPPLPSRTKPSTPPPTTSEESPPVKQRSISEQLAKEAQAFESAKRTGGQKSEASPKPKASPPPKTTASTPTPTSPPKIDFQRGKIRSFTPVGEWDLVPEADLIRSFQDVDLSTPDHEYDATVSTSQLLTELNRNANNQAGTKDPTPEFDESPPQVSATGAVAATLAEKAPSPISKEEDTKSAAEKKTKVLKKEVKVVKKKTKLKTKKKSSPPKETDKDDGSSDIQGLANLDDEREETVMEEDATEVRDKARLVGAQLFQPASLDTATQRAQNVPHLSWKWLKFDNVPALNQDLGTFRIMSWNTLSSTLEPNKDFQGREKHVLQLIENAKAQAYCLQEVTEEFFKEELEPAMKKKGYGGVWTPKGSYHDRFTQNKHLVDGCATFYSLNKFIHRGTEALELRQGFFARKGDRFGVRDDVQRALLKKDQVAQFVMLEVLPELRPVDKAGFVLRPKKKFLCLANTHLLRAANPEHLTLIQLQTLTYNLETYIKSKTQYPDPAVIFCADVNRMPHSTSYSFLETGEVHPDRLRDSYGKPTTSQMFAHPFKLKSVSKLHDGEPQFTCGAGTVDFVWYSENSLARTRWLSVPPGGLGRNTLVKPSPQLPSDHLPQIAEFGFLANSTPLLPKDAPPPVAPATNPV